METSAAMQMVLITGMSGSGKSVALYVVGASVGATVVWYEKATPGTATALQGLVMVGAGGFPRSSRLLKKKSASAPLPESETYT